MKEIYNSNPPVVAAIFAPQYILSLTQSRFQAWLDIEVSQLLGFCDGSIDPNSQSAVTCSKLTIKTLKKCVKYVHS